MRYSSAILSLLVAISVLFVAISPAFLSIAVLLAAIFCLFAAILSLLVAISVLFVSNIVFVSSNIYCIFINCRFIAQLFFSLVIRDMHQQFLPILSVLSAILALLSCYLIINMFQLVFCSCTTRYSVVFDLEPGAVLVKPVTCGVSTPVSRFYFWRCNRIDLRLPYRKVTSFLVATGEVFTILCNGNVIAIDELNCVATLNLFSRFTISYYIPSR